MSLIETYQSCKSLFAEKLITKGVNADGSDGLTTLINKIDGIQQFGNGVFVWADKPILQDGETSNLYGLVLNEGNPVVGEQVNFYDGLFGFDGLVFEDSFNRTAQSYTQTPEKLTVTSTGAQGMTALTGLQFDGDYTVEFKCKGDSVFNGMRFSIQSVNATSIGQYILAVNYEMGCIRLDYNNSTTHVDVQNPADSNEHTVKFKITGNTAKLYFDGVLKIDRSDLTWLHDPLQLTVHSWGALTLEVYDFRITGDFLGYDDTDSKGVASVGYSGKGAGLLNIRCDCMERRFVSETFSIIDALLFDHCTSEISGRWYNYQSILSISYTESGMTITKDETNNTQRYLYYNDPTISTTKVGGYNSITTPIEILFNVKAITGSIQLVIVDNNSNQRFIDITETGNYKLTFNGSTLVIKLNDTQLGNSYVVDGSNFQFRFGFNAQGESITIQDFTVYPI